jgi:hypothetical protein
MAPKEEVVVPLRTSNAGSVAPATHVRSTLLLTSVRSLRARNLLEPYLSRLPADMHDIVLHAVAGAWLPIEVGLAHYGAADALGLRASEQFEIGQEVAERVQNTLLGTLVRVAKSAGVTPWVGLEYFQRLWDRVVLGGAAAVYRLGPKEARAEVYGIDLVQFAYFRNGWRGMIAGSGALFASRVFVTELPRYTTKSSTAFRISWA